MLDRYSLFNSELGFPERLGETDLRDQSWAAPEVG
jgi:hypothetical protein